MPKTLEKTLIQPKKRPFENFVKEKKSEKSIINQWYEWILTNFEWILNELSIKLYD